MKVGIKIASSCVVNAATVRCYKQSASGPWQVSDTYQWSLCTLYSTRVRHTLLYYLLWPCCHVILC